MKINSIDNDINFKGKFKIKVTRDAFGTMNEREVEDCFNNMLTEAIERMSGKSKQKSEKLTWVEKLRCKFKPVQKTSEKPKVAIMLFQYPGYRHIQQDVLKNGKTWFDWQLKKLYGSDRELPEINDHYNFFLLTENEKDELIKFQPKIDQLAVDFEGQNLELTKQEKELYIKMRKCSYESQLVSNMKNDHEYRANALCFLPEKLDEILKNLN